jgi:hypothetical protein
MDAKMIGDIGEAHLFKQRASGVDVTVPPSPQFRRDLLELLGREVARIGRLSNTVQEWGIGRS